MPQAKHPQWTKIDPKDMTNDQLAAATNNIRAQLDNYNAVVTNLNAMWFRAQAEVNARFGVALPGVPPVEAQQEWPTEFAKGYDWSFNASDFTPDASGDDTPTPEPDTAPDSI